MTTIQNFLSISKVFIVGRKRNLTESENKTHMTFTHLALQNWTYAEQSYIKWSISKDLADRVVLVNEVVDSANKLGRECN